MTMGIDDPVYEFAGMGFHVATPEEVQRAMKEGRPIERDDGTILAYEYRGDIWLVEGTRCETSLSEGSKEEHHRLLRQQGMGPDGERLPEAELFAVVHEQRERAEVAEQRLANVGAVAVRLHAEAQKFLPTPLPEGEQLSLARARERASARMEYRTRMYLYARLKEAMR